MTEGDKGIVGSILVSMINKGFFNDVKDNETRTSEIKETIKKLGESFA